LPVASHKKLGLKLALLSSPEQDKDKKDCEFPEVRSQFSKYRGDPHERHKCRTIVSHSIYPSKREKFQISKVSEAKNMCTELGNAEAWATCAQVWEQFNLPVSGLATSAQGDLLSESNHTILPTVADNLISDLGW
ncbi:hypothetical protein X801_01609, partial [Opisthorchis viverrini]